jgi:bifunctional non-homologous end joining protein LigD
MKAKKDERQEIPQGDYFYEVKWDGIRAIIQNHDRVTIFSKSGRDITDRFPEIADAAPQALECGTYDCELVVFCVDGRPSFPLVNGRLHLQDEDERARRMSEQPVTAVLFDVLELNGYNLEHADLSTRRAHLESASYENHRFILSKTYDDGEALLEEVGRLGLEGVIAKERGSAYRQGSRTKAWLKVKLQVHKDVLVVGYTDGIGKREGFIGALVLESLSGEDRGRVGTGFTDRDLVYITERLQRIGVRFTRKDVHYLREPQLAEVQAMKVTDDGLLREPVFRCFKDGD